MNHLESNKISCRTRWSFLSAIASVLVALVLLLPVDPAFSAPYLNSAESMCNVNDSTVLMCDDFENGVWYQTDCDSGGYADPNNDGWCGNVFNTSPANAVCGGAGAVGTNCTATSGNRMNSGKWQAFHKFGPNANEYNEIYHRYYIKFSSNYDFGHEKLIAYHRDDSINGQVAFLKTSFGNNMLSFEVMQVPEILNQNQGQNLSITPGRWYYVEVRVKLDTPMGSGNGIIQLWSDDCGTNGLGCTGPGTLRLSRTNLNIRRNNSWGLGAIHQENWLPTSGDPNCCGGGEVHNDQIIVRTTRIGPMGVMQPPFNLKAQ